MLRFTPITVPHNVIVVGCGGTGSRLVPLLAQFLRSIMKEHNPRGWLGTPNLVLCDFDTIEPKNLLRQNFVTPDITKNKAVVLSERYGRAYGINVVPMTTKITENTDIMNFFQSKLNTNIIDQPLLIIMCVDSVSARRTILSNALFLRANASSGNPSNIVIIDSGNEDNFGQVNIFNPVVLTMDESSTNKALIDQKYPIPKMITSVTDINFIPMDLTHYVSLIDHPGTGSCADLDQTLAINALIATNIMAMVQNYYYRKPFTYNSVNVDMAGGSYTTHNTFSNFKSKAITGGVSKFIKDTATENPSLRDSIREILNAVNNPASYSVMDLQQSIFKSEELLAAENKQRVKDAERAEKERIKAEKEAAKAALVQVEVPVVSASGAPTQKKFVKAKKGVEVEKVDVSGVDRMSGISMSAIQDTTLITVLEAGIVNTSAIQDTPILTTATDTVRATTVGTSTNQDTHTTIADTISALQELAETNNWDN